MLQYDDVMKIDYGTHINGKIMCLIKDFSKDALSVGHPKYFLVSVDLTFMLASAKRNILA